MPQRLYNPTNLRNICFYRDLLQGIDMTPSRLKTKKRLKVAATEHLLTVLSLLDVITNQQAWTAQFLYTFVIYNKAKDEG